MRTAALYIRVSSREQAEGMSIPAQLTQLQEWASKNDYIVNEEHIFIEAGETARYDDRPEFQKMIAIAKRKPKPFDAVLVHKYDRFARNREHSITYKSLLRHECGIDVISITEKFGDDPIGRLMEAIIEAIAEFYSANLAHEVMKGKKEAAKSGLVHSEPPYGYAIGEESGKFVIYEPEARVVRRIFDLYVRDGKGLRAISMYLRSQPAIEEFGGYTI